ncbi:molybdate ABC transporter substrate-binding protein [Croceicoccus sp. F390]|uniref:Molybdate ABC transporter substrate-binding protein n=1 Tax=Croceicoccus esteveae TaxID=3075597 RepID=A0ABU2ZE67_9SPHN|nr:molybdate ABC transporter substrate-binding protein [Croceicoccus sp. F390]MDT0574899.1 molybdate ABC transporter substrate-binding protein [Croceicoccus sp. F390]
MTRPIKLLFISFLTLFCAACTGAGRTDGPVVLAAASMQEALEEISATWAAQGHSPPLMSFAGSSTLARQLQQGAPADLFISADAAWMDELAAGRLLRDGSRSDLAGNTLVLIAPREADVRVELDDSGSVLAALGDSRLAIADPDAVPAGRYGRSAMMSLDLWDHLRDRLAVAENVRAALAMVERGSATLGVVYATDATASDKVQVVARFNPADHPPIRYPVAVLAASSHTDADAFRAFLDSDAARRILRQHGFTAVQ